MFDVTLHTPGAGLTGDTAAVHTGGLTLTGGTPPAAGVVRVTAPTAAAAVTAALSGAVRVEVGNKATTYTFGPTTAGGAAADHRPYFVFLPDGRAGFVRLEDLAGTPNKADWDYNDRAWRVSVRPVGGTTLEGGGVTPNGGGEGDDPYPTSPPPPPSPITFPVKGDATLWDFFGQSAKVEWEVTNPTEDKFHWKYTVTNNDLHTYAFNAGFNMGVVAFAVATNAPADGFTASPGGWAVSGYEGGVSWGGPSYTLMPGGVGVFAFDTPPVPMVEADAEATAGARTATTAVGTVLAPAAPPTVSIQVESLIPVNANNDNFEPIYSTDTLHEVINEADRWKSEDLPYIPKVRDFDAAHLWQDDPQLLPVTLTVSGNLAGTLSAQVTSVAGGGVGRLWKDARKNEAFTSINLPALAAGADHPAVVVYLEGAHESKVLDDVKVEAKFAVGNAEVPATPKTVSVTPVVLNPTNKPTNLKIGPGFGGYGIAASDPANAPDADVTFGYSAFVTGDQSGGFLQNVLNVVNGPVWGGHGIEGPLFNADRLLDPSSGGAFPLLDHTNANQAALDPRYSLVTVNQLTAVFSS